MKLKLPGLEYLKLDKYCRNELYTGKNKQKLTRIPDKITSNFAKSNIEVNFYVSTPSSLNPTKCPETLYEYLNIPKPTFS